MLRRARSLFFLLWAAAAPDALRAPRASAAADGAPLAAATGEAAAADGGPLAAATGEAPAPPQAPPISAHGGGRAMALPSSPLCDTVLTGVTNFGLQSNTSSTLCTNAAGSTYAASTQRASRVQAAPGYRYAATLNYYATETGGDLFTFYTLTSTTTALSVTPACFFTPTDGVFTTLLPLTSGTQTCGTAAPCGVDYDGLYGGWNGFCVRRGPLPPHSLRPPFC